METSIDEEKRLPPAGAFGWKRRMGVHEAYHQNPTNRLIHWIAIPFELCSVVALLACLRLGPARDAALVAIVLVAPIYLATEVFAGALMVGFLLGCRELALRLSTLGLAWEAGAAVLVFATTFTLQVWLGHGRFEGGRDDTQKNLAELRATKNPVPILLVFYYHLVELLLAAGYRPGLRRDIESYAERERRSFETT